MHLALGRLPARTGKEADQPPSRHGTSLPGIEAADMLSCSGQLWQSPVCKREHNYWLSLKPWMLADASTHHKVSAHPDLSQKLYTSVMPL